MYCELKVIQLLLQDSPPPARVSLQPASSTIMTGSDQQAATAATPIAVPTVMANADRARLWQDLAANHVSSS